MVPAPSVLDLYVYNVQTYTFPPYRDALTVSIIASASYGLPYLPANAQSDAVPGVGALALSAAMLFNFQGAPRLTLGGTASGLLVFDVLPSSYVHIIVSVSKKIKPFSQSCRWTFT